MCLSRFSHFLFSQNDYPCLHSQISQQWKTLYTCLFCYDILNCWVQFLKPLPHISRLTPSPTIYQFILSVAEHWILLLSLLLPLLNKLLKIKIFVYLICKYLKNNSEYNTKTWIHERNDTLDFIKIKNVALWKTISKEPEDKPETERQYSQKTHLIKDGYAKYT